MNEIQPAKTDLEKMKRNAAWKDVRNFLLRLILFIGLMYVFLTYVVGIARVPTDDMRPAFRFSDTVVYYRMQEMYKTRDVVYMVKDNAPLIGRIIGVPGDIIEILDSGSVRVNGNIVFEDYVYENTYPYVNDINYPVVLDADSYFILGDNRSLAYDSRAFGPVRRNEIQGVIILSFRRNNL